MDITSPAVLPANIFLQPILHSPPLPAEGFPVTMEEIMKKRQKEIEKAYEEQWDAGRGSHHPDFDPDASGDDVVKASRETEELYNAIGIDNCECSDIG